MIKPSIIVVEDEDDLRELLQFNLTKEGYEVAGAATGEKALELIRSRPPHLLLLDLMLPGIDGLEVTRRLKGDPSTRAIPIIMLTARGEEADIVAGLELGADDYITKPFSRKVLVARIRAVLRRKASEEERHGPITIHELVIHPGRHEVMVGGQPLSLTPTEFGILHFLAKHPGWVYTRSQIVDAVKGRDYFVTDRTVDVQMVGLRRKLGPAGRYLETVRGVGYRFKD